jgi:hypothetical protein
MLGYHKMYFTVLISEWVVHPFFKLLQGKDVSLFDYASLNNFDKERTFTESLNYVRNTRKLPVLQVIEGFVEW